MQAIEVYRASFEPSQHLDKPYVMVGVPLVAAEADSEATYLATSALQRHLRVIRGEPIYVPPPVKSMDGLWSEPERALVESRLTVAAIGGPEAIRQKLNRLLQQTRADELIFTSDLYDHARRLRSFEIAANVLRQ
jgi:alkanesulfonate monooxygenase SsuD/methylene tetrahydromethanopterin reductase-like flavin-dependent oxidoreductase (luciferase family)